MKDKQPKGGWLGPPGNTQTLKPLAIARKTKNGKWLWEDQELTEKQEKNHRKFQRAMKEADKEGEWSFDWA